MGEQLNRQAGAATPVRRLFFEGRVKENEQSMYVLKNFNNSFENDDEIGTSNKEPKGKAKTPI